MCNVMIFFLVKCFRPLIDCFNFIYRTLYNQVEIIFRLSSIYGGINTPFIVERLLNSNQDLESIYLISEDLCAIAENNASCSKRNSLSAELSSKNFGIDKESESMTVDKISSDNALKRNDSRLQNGLIDERDLPVGTTKNSACKVTCSKSSVHSVMLNEEYCDIMLNGEVCNNSFKENRVITKNCINSESDLQSVSAQNGVIKLSLSNSSLQPMLNEESCGSTLRNSFDNANQENDELQTRKSFAKVHRSKTASNQSKINKVCRYSLEPLNSKIGSLQSSVEKNGLNLSCKEQLSQSVKNNTNSYIDQIIQNSGFSNKDKTNTKSKTKVNGEKKNSTALEQNFVENVCKDSSSVLHVEIEDVSNADENGKTLHCFEKFRCAKEIKASNVEASQGKSFEKDATDENTISLENSKLRMRRLGVSYTKSASLEPSKPDQPPIDSFNPSHLAVDEQKNLCYSTSPTSSICDTHGPKRLSLPNIYSGCIYATTKEVESINFRDFSLDPIKVPYQAYRVMSFPDLFCGGMVVLEELSRHVSLPNLYDKDPIIFKENCINLNFPPIASLEDLRIKKERVLYRSLSGGGLVEENDSRKISLPNIIADRSLEDYRGSSSYRTMSGGGLVNFPDSNCTF